MVPSQAQYSTALCSKLQGWWRRQACHLAPDPAHPLLRALSAPGPTLSHCIGRPAQGIIARE